MTDRKTVRRAVILLSGGLDSATCLLIAREERFDAAANDTDFFFVPKDIKATDDNAAAALRKAQELKTETEIVPVATLEEAVHYLERLPFASEDDT